jgi:hypothetical protein
MVFFFHVNYWTVVKMEGEVISKWVMDCGVLSDFIAFFICAEDGVRCPWRRQGGEVRSEVIPATLKWDENGKPNQRGGIPVPQT